MLAAAAGCPTPHAAPTPPAAADDPAPPHADTAPPTAGSPPPAATAGAPDIAALSASALAHAQAAGLSGHTPAPGPQLGEPVAGVKRLDGPWYPRPRVPKHKDPYYVDNAELLFSTAPWGTTDGGELVVRFETRVPTQKAVLYGGLRLEADPLAPPRYRTYTIEAPGKAVRKHELRIKVSRLLDPRKDVAGVHKRGWGEVAWQVEVPYPQAGSTALIDGRLAIRVDDKTIIPQPTVVLGPFVHQVDKTNAVVVFETNTPVTAVVGAGPVTASSPKPATRHEIPLKGLAPNTIHPYRVAVSDGRETSVTPPRTLTTPGQGPLTVAIMSDSRSDVAPGMNAYNGVNAAVLSRLLAGAYRNGAQAVFFPGDLIDGYVSHVDDFEWQLRAWLKVVEGVHGHIPFYTGMGNHESLVDVWSDAVVLDKPGAKSGEARFAALMANPGGAPPPENAVAPPYDETVYSVDIQGVHFVMLNTNYWYTRQPGHPRHEGKGNREGMPMENQLQWLEADLKAATQRGVRHIVVMGHEPAFPVGGHTKDAMWWHGKIPEVNQVRERFWKLLAEHGVLAYVSGDEHNYSRSLIGPETVQGAAGSVYSVVSGGCGAPYYALDPPAEYADRVQKFSAQQHYTLWTFEEGKAPRLRVFGLTGALIEDQVLREAGAAPTAATH